MGITLLVIPGMDPIMVVQGRTTAEDMPLTRAPSQLRLAIGRITRMAPGITSGEPTMYGGRDIGDGSTGRKSGSADTTW